MTERSFLDTNVLLYTDDADAPRKRERAIELIERARFSSSAVVSTQVLQEYFAAATRKLGVPATTARAKVEIFGRLQLVQLDLPLILEATDLHQLHQLSIWDSLIVCAAKAGASTKLITEDLQDGQQFGSLVVENPFRDLE